MYDYFQLSGSSDKSDVDLSRAIFKKQQLVSANIRIGFLKSNGDIVNAFIHPSRDLLLNHWVEFYQTCYITSPHGKGVQEQHFFLCVHLCIRRPSICLSHYLLLNHWVEFNQSCYITSPNG